MEDDWWISSGRPLRFAIGKLGAARVETIFRQIC